MAPLAALRRDTDRDENEVATAEAGKYDNMTDTHRASESGGHSFITREREA